MSLFQNSVVNKYLKNIDIHVLNNSYIKFCEYFNNPIIQQNIKDAKEEQFQEGFLRELFVKILGYTLNPQPDYNLTTELKNVKDSKKADGAIIINNTVKAVIELKGTNITDLGKIESQAFNYKNNQLECVYVITSNFEKLRFYIENAIEHIEFNLFNLSLKEFELLYLCLSFNSIQQDLPKKIKDESVSQEDIITKKLYKDYSLFKRELHNNLVTLNPQYDALTLFKKSQKLLDRFLFLFFAEDRLLLPPNSVRLILNDWQDLKDRDVEIPLYDRFKKYFEYLNTGYKGKRYDVYAYNGGLFKRDDILDSVKIDDNLLYQHTYRLSEYDFVSEVDVNILGHIFENSLNEIEEIQSKIEGVEVDKSKTKRKKDGVFYTPKYITKYIIDNTVGKLCKEKKEELNINDEDYSSEKKIQHKNKQILVEKLSKYRDWLLQITICDPACGSGAFLNQALDFLISEHRYIDELQAKLFGDVLVMSDIETSILENNLFGVDLNEESVEIAKLSLWLRTAKPNRKLNDLSNNIKCGNSLIDDPAIAGEKAFNWHKEFSKVFEIKNKKAWHITTATHDTRTSQRMIDYKVKESRADGEMHIDRSFYIDDKDAIIITSIISDIIQEDAINCLAYNILTDHIHFIIVCEEDELTNIVRKIKGKSAQKFKEYLQIPKDEVFNLWAQKFHKNLIVNKEQLYSTIHYINNNRNKHGLTDINKGLQPLADNKYGVVDNNNGQQPLVDNKHGVADNNNGQQPLANNKHGVADINKGLQPLVQKMICSPEHAFRTEYKGGFNVVIGNPPYVLCQPSNTDEITLNYYKLFKVVSFKIDLYHLFYEKAINLLKVNGLLGFITPNTYLTNKYLQSLRNFILNKTFIEAIVNYNDNVFFDAGVDVATLILKKSQTFNSNIPIFISRNSNLKLHTTKSQSVWNNDFEQTFNLNLDFNIKINYNKCILLEELCTVTFGLQTKDKNTFVSESKKEDDWEKCYTGKDVNRYLLNEPSLFFKNAPNIVKAGGSWNMEFHKSKKIVVRQIGNPEPIFAFDLYGYATLNTMYSIVLKNKEYDYLYLLALLNSLLIKKIWLSKYYDNKDLFPKIKGYQLKQLPIRKISKDDQQPFIEKADIMLSLNKELQEISQKFQRSIERKFEINPLPNKLQDWYLLTYADFIKELAKKKIKLSLAEEAEWEEYFQAESRKAQALKLQIAETDNEIDRMVYELYGLTEEEIKIVEGN